MNDQEYDGEDRQFIRSYMNTEYTSLRNEINQYKTGQITLFTATASATGIMLGIFINLIKVGEFNLLHALLVMMPLIVIIPSSFMFFEKAVNINKLEAYCTVYTDRFMRDPSSTEKYLGYPNYKTDYNELFSKPMPDFKRPTDKYMAHTKRYVTNAIKYFINWFIYKETKYWVNFCYAYWGLTCTCFVVYIVYAFGSISELSEAIFAAFTKYNLYLISFAIFIWITSLILRGRIYVKDKRFWRQTIFNQLDGCTIIFLLMIIDEIFSNPFILLIFEIPIIIIAAYLVVEGKRLKERVKKMASKKILTEEEMSVLIYLGMVVIYAAYLIYSLFGNILSERAFVSIICLTIISATLIWNFVSTSSIIFVNASYQAAKTRWEYCITNKLPKKYPHIILIPSNTDETGNQEDVQKDE